LPPDEPLLVLLSLPDELLLSLLLLLLEPLLPLSLLLLSLPLVPLELVSDEEPADMHSSRTGNKKTGGC
jgi:hypothetical protein